LHKHLEDFKNDNNLLSADILGLAEARGLDMLDDRLKIEGFQVYATHGLVIYFNRTLNVEFICSKTISSIEYSLVGLKEEFVIGFVYCTPQQATVTNLALFLSSVHEEITQYVLTNTSFKLVLMGDFNFECNGQETLTKLFENECQLTQLIKTETLDYASRIDQIYTNLCESDISAFGTLESYYSDHKPIYLALYSSKKN
jgi:hypothetical protein